MQRFPIILGKVNCLIRLHINFTYKHFQILIKIFFCYIEDKCFVVYSVLIFKKSDIDIEIMPIDSPI